MKNENLRKDCYYIIGIFIFSMAISFPFFQSKIINGCNISEYLSTFAEFHENIRNWSLIPGWAADSGNGYGLPLFIFTPPLFYYISEIFHLAGFNLLASTSLSCSLLLLLSGIFMYLFVREFLLRTPGFFASVIYMLSPFLLASLFPEHTPADFSSLPLPPLIIWSLHKLICVTKNHFRYFFLASFSSALFMLSGPETQILLLFILFICIIVVKTYQKKQPVKLLPVTGAFFAGICLSSFFWLPALLEKKYIKTPVFRWEVSLISGFFLSLTIAAMFYLMKNKFNKFWYYVAAASFISILILYISYAMPYEDYKITGKDFSPEHIAAKEISQKLKYEPVWIKERIGKYPEKKFTPVRGDAGLIHEKIHPAEYYFMVAVSGYSRLRININYFPGWKAYIGKSYLDLKETDIDYSNKYGLIEISVPPGYAFIGIRFENTLVRWAGIFLSYFGVISLYFVFLFSKKNKLSQKTGFVSFNP